MYTYRINFAVVGFVMICILIGILLFLPDILQTAANPQNLINVTVTDKYVKRISGSDVFYVVVRDTFGSLHVLQNVDAILQMKYNSADIQASLEIGRTYTIYTHGWRVRLFSWYPNITKVFG